MCAPNEPSDLLVRAYQRTNEARRSARRWARQVKDQTALEAAADALVEAAAELPDVVKTKRLQQAIGRYRKARGAE